MTSAMTDNRTTELTATERICEQLEAAGVSFVRSEQIIEGTYWGVTWFVGETKFEFRENDMRTDLIAFNATPEQAVAATLGAGECEPIIEPWACAPNKYDAYCGNCKYPLGDGKIKPWNFCPNCGAKVVG